MLTPAELIMKSIDSQKMWVELRILHPGANKKTTITQEAITAAEPSAQNIPIVGFWGGEDFEGHEYTFRWTEDGLIKEYAGTIIGFVPETNNLRYETESDGRTWVIVDGFICRKYADYSLKALYSGKQISMEIDILDFIDTPEEYIIKLFAYQGICILGDHRIGAVSDAKLIIKDQDSYELAVRNLKGEYEMDNGIQTPAPNAELEKTEPAVELEKTESTAEPEKTEPATVEQTPAIPDLSVYEAEIKALKQRILSQYAIDFADVATAEQIGAMQGTIEEIELQLYALRGKKASMADYAIDVQTTKINQPSWVELMK